MYTLITIKIGKKQYDCRISSFNYTGKNLWIFIHGTDGSCGYIPNGKVIAMYGTMDKPFVPDELIKHIRAW